MPIYVTCNYVSEEFKVFGSLEEAQRYFDTHLEVSRIEEYVLSSSLSHRYVFEE